MNITMSFDIVMDRPVTTAHYISPGGYALRFAAGHEESFDFIYSNQDIDEVDPHVVRCIVRGFDPDAASGTDVSLAYHLKHNGVAGTAVSEFYVHTGETGDPEIHCVGVRNWSITVENDGNTDVYLFSDFNLDANFAPLRKVRVVYSIPVPDMEPPISTSVTVPYGIDAWEYLKKLVMHEACAAFCEHAEAGPIGLELYPDEQRAVVHFPWDDTSCTFSVSSKED